MAEPIGLIASVIQVAGAGLKLSQTLYQYVDGVATADRRIKDIAKEIELTSFVVEELGNVFKQDETSNLISKNAVKTANETMKECSTVFADIDATLKKSKKNTLGRLMLPFRDTKIELLRNHIDKLKSTLQLLMQVLTHAHQVASKKLDREAEAKQREDIRELLENKKRSTKRYEESLRNFSVSDGSTITDNDQESEKDNDDPMSTDALTIAASAIGSTITPDTLGKCVQHIRSLLEDIETLQQALTSQVAGDDHSEHHQSLIGSYFRARGHLDSVLLGSAKNPDTSSLTSTTLQAKVREAEIGIQKTMTGSTLNQISSRSDTLMDANFSKALQEATERARVEEKERWAAKVALEAAHSKATKSPHAERQTPISFQDTLGRKYTVPFHVCSTWEGMYKFIKEAYVDESSWKQHVHNRSFKLTDANGNILLSRYWSSVIEPGSTIAMQFLSTCKPIEGHDSSLRRTDTNNDVEDQTRLTRPWSSAAGSLRLKKQMTGRRGSRAWSLGVDSRQQTADTDTPLPDSTIDEPLPRPAGIDAKGGAEEPKPVLVASEIERQSSDAQNKASLPSVKEPVDQTNSKDELVLEDLDMALDLNDDQGPETPKYPTNLKFPSHVPVELSKPVFETNRRARNKVRKAVVFTDTEDVRPSFASVRPRPSETHNAPVFPISHQPYAPYRIVETAGTSEGAQSVHKEEAVGSSKPLPDDDIALKRARNTLAARESRQRKFHHVGDIERPKSELDLFDPYAMPTKHTHKAEVDIDATVRNMPDDIEKVSEWAALLDGVQDKTDNPAVSAQGVRQAISRQPSSGPWESVPRAVESTSDEDAGNGRIQIAPPVKMPVPKSLPPNYDSGSHDAPPPRFGGSGPYSYHYSLTKGKSPEDSPRREVRESLNARSEYGASTNTDLSSIHMTPAVAKAVRLFKRPLVMNKIESPPVSWGPAHSISYPDAPSDSIGPAAPLRLLGRSNSSRRRSAVASHMSSLPYARLPPPPPPTDRIDLPLSSATYIPCGDSFGSGVGIPQLHTETPESDVDRARYKHKVSSNSGSGRPSYPSVEDWDEDDDEDDDEVEAEVSVEGASEDLDEVDELLKEWTNVLGGED
ncbi:uncharacterized protein K460DRAFT_399726 [Cucurbitaria berberidis CBS 394.84]|uniref:BZIP domain-containing protein n=1 Tax=Cucurbitaria berberidis CBS 394.84 TaxID=1168544 RepID=A0A9P4GQT1_9PLEO|nr:uncharacterized protein K460DRAFT_399726 [Cucurbitaria berberidis CBS 394.84]KAF1849610.1 hypothetical protein K460DRAFT_399726 [Cucurbitaria berberidis CBS 394.84]